MSTSRTVARTLIERAKVGDREALHQLLLTYSRELTAHVAARIPESLRAIYGVEDVVQQAMTRAFLKIDRLRETSPKAFVVWLKAIGEKTLIELIRAERRQKRGGAFRRIRHINSNDIDIPGDIMEHLPCRSATASQVIARREAIVALQASLAGLPRDQRRAIQLCLLQRKSLAEAAREMGRTPGAVRGLVRRGKQQLSEAMGRASAWLSTR